MAAPKTLAELWTQAVATYAKEPAQEWHDGSAWKTRTYAEFGRAVDDLANAMLSCGLKPGERVAIWSRNSPRWAEADFAAVSAGLVTVPIYDTLTSDKAAYIANDAGARLLFVQSGILPRALEALPRLAMIERVVVLDGDGGQGAQGYDAFLQAGRAWGAAHPKALAEARARVQADDLASLVYTSGTTAEPKGAMLTHGNFASNSDAMTLVKIGPGDVFVSFLPLSHVFERLGGHFGAYRFGAKVVFARSLETLMEDLAHARPTLMMAVPRLYEKMYARVQDAVASGSPVKRALFQWAVATGREANAYRAKGEPLPAPLARKVWFADRLVLHKVRDRVGGRLRYFVSGGAALSRDIEEFFWACGVSILQGYGLTETSPVCNVNYPGNVRFGSVGKTIPGVTCRIDTSEWTPIDAASGRPAEGEICFKGPNVMKGYWRNEKATREVFDREGWFHTGDIGYVDAEGYLYITDRKKEIIVMSNGKKVPPQPIENALKLQPHIAQACVLGDGRNYISAIVVPDWEAVERFALQQGIAAKDRKALAADERVVSLLDREVQAVNQGLSRFEQVKRFTIADSDWTVESGELTPSLKLKRRVVGERFKDAIDDLYDGDGGPVAAPVPVAKR